MDLISEPVTTHFRATAMSCGGFVHVVPLQALYGYNVASCKEVCPNTSNVIMTLGGGRGKDW